MNSDRKNKVNVPYLRNICFVSATVCLAIMIFDTSLLQTQNFQIFAQPIKNKNFLNGGVKASNKDEEKNNSLKTYSYDPFGKSTGLSPLVNIQADTTCVQQGESPYCERTDQSCQDFAFNYLCIREGETDSFTILCPLNDCYMTEGPAGSTFSVSGEVGTWTWTNAGPAGGGTYTSPSHTSDGAYIVTIHNPCCLDPGLFTLVDVIESQNHPPLAQATIQPSESVENGITVTLDGSGSTDPDPGDSVQKYTWEQIGAPSVDLNNAVTNNGDTNAGKANFIAPEFTQDTTLTFRLTVEDTHGAPSSMTVDVLVKAPDVCGVLTGSLSIPNPFQSLGTADPTIETSSGSSDDGLFSVSNLRSDKFVKLKPYNIKAFSLKEAGAQFKYPNPDNPLEKLASKAQSNLKIEWHANRNDIVCRAKIIGDIDVSYPKLATLKKLSQPAQAEWLRFINKTLNVHEAGHVKIIEDGFTKAANEFIGKKPEQVQGILDAAINKINLDNRAYDILTKHGATQGAALDINIK